jgi:hypothetical protein
VLLTLLVSSYLPEGPSHHGVKQAIPCQLWPHSNSSSGELMLPPCGLRPSLGFIQVCLMLHWGSPI